MFPPLVQADIQVQAKRRGSSLDSNTRPGAAPAFMGETFIRACTSFKHCNHFHSLLLIN